MLFFVKKLCKDSVYNLLTCVDRRDVRMSYLRGSPERYGVRDKCHVLLLQEQELQMSEEYAEYIEVYFL